MMVGGERVMVKPGWGGGAGVSTYFAKAEGGG